MSRLIYTANPEQTNSSSLIFNGQQWAIKYDYDLNSNLTTKTDSRVNSLGQLLQDGGVEPHDIKPKKGGSRFDLFKDKDGNIYVLPKSGKGDPDPTGLNIKDY